ncbi:thioredoxin family protein [Mucilaginibacter sp. UR6-1]|uniref:thioredoxin family protein n=1 Tax=Mucilaginibacter sp. UR6-1 TaxID=1435643 RepID=UPI001E6161A7|nr:thioredoxin family protein [Mucilaginibacter sp. UR6-1]MCC8407649.1 thioredoxin family protein [Mucilaginibacter sp. UR6-1]
MMADFDSHIFYHQANDAESLLIYSFWAPWCSSCAMLKPVLNALEQEYNKKISIISVNVDDEPDLAAQFSVRYIPALIFIKNGRVVGQHTGAIPYKDIDIKINALLA